MIPAIFSQDWFNRTKEFVANNNTSSFVQVSMEDNYCTFLYSENRINELLNNKMLLLDELYSIIRMLDLGTVRILLKNNDIHACTTGDYIEIGINFEDKKLSNPAKLDVIIGLLLHEACHCLYTDFKYGNSIMGKYHPLVHHIHNVIEDELIEQKLGAKFPGYMNFVKKVKYYFWNGKKTSKDMLDKDDFQTALNLLLFVVRYPMYIQNLPEKTLNKFAPLFENIKHIMRDCSCFNLKDEFCTINSTASAIQIFELLISYFNIDMKLYEDTQDIFDIFSGGLGEICDSISEEITPEEAQKYHRTVEKSAKEEDKEFELENERKEVGSEKSKLRAISIYNSYLREVSPYISMITKLLKPNEFKKNYISERFRKNGSLDPSRLANAMCNEKLIYRQIKEKIEKIDSRYTVLITIDESGSMKGGKINTVASKLAVLFYEGFATLENVELFIYGHGDMVYKYIDPYNCDKFALGARNQQGGQNEVRSYNIILSEVRKLTDRPIIMFNITDSAYLSNPDMIKEEIDKFRKDNIFVNLICLDHHFKNSYGDMNDKIYGKGNWVLYDPQEFAMVNYTYIINELVRIIKTNVKL